jgi:hypothetical protein
MEGEEYASGIHAGIKSRWFTKYWSAMWCFIESRSSWRWYLSRPWSGKQEDRPGLKNCLKALRKNDTLVVWKLDRLGRDLRHLVNTVHDLTAKDIGFKVLTGQGAAIDTTGHINFNMKLRERSAANLQAAFEAAEAAGTGNEIYNIYAQFLTLHYF